MTFCILDATVESVETEGTIDEIAAGTQQLTFTKESPMTTESDFLRLADKVRNWGRWGARDELGTLNLIEAHHVVVAASAVRRGSVFPLGIEFGANGPQGDLPFRSNPLHLMTVDGGDASALLQYGPAAQGNLISQTISGIFGMSKTRFNDDVIIMPLQAATQWDALSHVYYDDHLYNGFPSASVTSAGASHCGIDKVQSKGITSRGVLIDVVRHRNKDIYLPPGEPISPEEIEDIAKAQNVTIGQGDILLFRTGWWAKYQETRNGSEPCSGVSYRCAQWFHDHGVAAIAADNVMVESTESEVDGVFMPLHLLTLREMGLMLGEYWDLEALAADCATDGVYEFQLTAPPLKVVGGVGSPINPLAIK